MLPSSSHYDTVDGTSVETKQFSKFPLFDAQPSEVPKLSDKNHVRLSEFRMTTLFASAQTVMCSVPNGVLHVFVVSVPFQIIQLVVC